MIVVHKISIILAIAIVVVSADKQGQIKIHYDTEDTTNSVDKHWTSLSDEWTNDSYDNVTSDISVDEWSSRSDYGHTGNTDWVGVEKAIRRRTKAKVYVRGLPEYDYYRQLANGGCKHIYPAMVVRPNNVKDLSEIVKISNEFNAEISVRSGGHSYQCQGSKDNSINIDMRRFNRVKILSPHEALIGAGNTWGHVFKKIPREHFTYVHGQCENVGVGGYILGLGFHLPSISNRYGLGSDQVLEYTMVMADGSIAKINNYNTTILDYHYHPGKVIPHGPDTDLKFALRIAGASYGILAEIKYKLYPKPETLPMVIPIYIENSYDFKNIQRAAARGEYGFYMFESYFFRQTSLTHGLALLYQKVPRILRVLNGKKVDPIMFAVADLRVGRKGNPHNAINFLKYHGIKPAIDSPRLLSAFGLDGFDLGFPTIEDGYLTKEQQMKEGFALLADCNILGLENTKPLDSIFFHHPIFGIYNKGRNQKLARQSGCEFCSWFYNFINPYANIDVVPNEDIGKVALEIACATNAYAPGKGRGCALTMANLKTQITKRLQKYGRRPFQYVNTPSCDKHGPPFYERYWGRNYDKLLRIKDFWDPYQKFNYCHSVGSTDNDCCPIN